MGGSRVGWAAKGERAGGAGPVSWITKERAGGSGPVKWSMKS